MADEKKGYIRKHDSLKLEKYSTREIAKELNISKSNVHKWLGMLAIHSKAEFRGKKKKWKKKYLQEDAGDAIIFFLRKADIQQYVRYAAKAIRNQNEK